MSTISKAVLGEDDEQLHRLAMSGLPHKVPVGISTFNSRHYGDATKFMKAATPDDLYWLACSEWAVDTYQGDADSRELVDLIIKHTFGPISLSRPVMINIDKEAALKWLKWHRPDVYKYVTE